MALSNSPLFQAASRQVKATAQRQFRQSDFGRLLSEVGRASKGGRPQVGVQDAVRRYGRLGRPQSAIKQLMGAELGGLVREIERYSRGSMVNKRTVSNFLASLGPAGKLIETLASPSKTSALTKELKAASDLVRAFGGEVLPGEGKAWKTLEDVERAYRAAQQRLQEYGFSVVGSEGPPKRFPQPEGERKTIDVYGGVESRKSRVPANHPMVTGEMVRAPSSTNVHEFGYDVDAGYLYVRFQASGGQGQRGGPGPLYRYSGVTPEEFMGLYRVRSQGGGNGPGAWVWDSLRIRGTVSGHQKDYELVGIMGGRVPRKATVRPKYQTIGKRGKPLKQPRKTKGVEEWYVQRQVKTHDGRWARSVLPTARVAGVRGVG